MSAKPELFGELEGVLARLADLHEALLAEADAKREAIVRGDLPGLEAILEREQALVARVEGEERTRQGLVAAARSALALAGEPLKLSAIIAAAPPSAARRLETVHARLKRILDRLRYRTRQNAELMKASMEHVDAFLRAMAGACAAPRGYGRDGKQQAQPVSLFNRSA